MLSLLVAPFIEFTPSFYFVDDKQDKNEKHIPAVC